MSSRTVLLAIASRAFAAPALLAIASRAFAAPALLAIALLALEVPELRGAEAEAPRYRRPVQQGLPDGRTAGAVRTGTERRVEAGLPTDRSPGTARTDRPCAAPQLLLIAPEHHPGRVVSPQPTLYWHLSEVPGAGCPGHGLRFSLIDPSEIDPLVDEALTMPAEPGLQALRLADHGVELEEGKRYVWSLVVLQSGPEQTATDPFVKAPMLRVAPPPTLEEELRSADTERRVHVYAAHGLWYDAVNALGALLGSRPEDPQLLAWRTQLLASEGLALD